MKPGVLLALAAALLAAQDTATVEGVVINKVTGAGIEGVTVSLWSSNTNSFKAVTNEAGVFQIKGLKPGDYSSSVQKNLYASPSSELSQLLDDGPKHHIGLGANPVRLRFELIPPAVLRGRVIGTDGNPAKATVVLGGGKPVSTDAGGDLLSRQSGPAGTLFWRGRSSPNMCIGKMKSARNPSRPIIQRFRIGAWRKQSWFLRAPS